MAIAASIVVGVVLIVWAGMVLWSATRSAAVRRHRPEPRDPSRPPASMAPISREPEALRGPFAFVLRGQIMDVVPAFAGDVDGFAVTVSDVAARHEPGADVRQHTVVTADTEHRWPWLRIHHADLDVPVLAHEALDLPVATGDWIVASGDLDFATEVATAELFALLERAPYLLQLELTPRHLLLAAPGRARDAELTDLVTLAAAILALLPAKSPPDPADEF